MNVRLLVLASAAIAVACISMEGPKSGAASISVIGLPSPSVVKGDTMRDSLGNAAPLQLAAFDASGDTLAGEPARFFLLDSGLAVVDSSSRLFISNGSNTGSVRVIATLGGLQTPPVPIPITVAPAFIVRTDTTTPDTLCALYSNESDSTKTLSPPLSVSVKGADASAAQGFIATYTLLFAPASVDATPSAYISDDAGRPMVRDTSNASGQTGRRVDVRFQKLANDTLRTGGKGDSVGVDVSVRYRGAVLPGSPVHFVVPIKARVTGSC